MTMVLHEYSEVVPVGDAGQYVLERLDKKSTKTGRTCIYKLRKTGSQTRAGLYLVDYDTIANAYIFEVGGYSFRWKPNTNSYELLNINTNSTNNAYRSLAESGYLLEGMSLTVLYLTGRDLGLDRKTPVDKEALRAALALAKEQLKEVEDFGVF